MAPPEIPNYEFVKKSDVSEVCDEVLSEDLIGDYNPGEVCSLFGLVSAATTLIGRGGAGLTIVGTACGLTGTCTLTDVIEDFTPCTDVTIYYYKPILSEADKIQNHLDVLLLFGCGSGDPLTVDDISPESVADAIKDIGDLAADGFEVAEEWGGNLSSDIQNFLAF